MATTTSNYGIRKPEPSDTVNVELDIAGPYDEIDEILAAKADTGHTHEYATDADVAEAVAALVAGAPGALDTLNELAAAIGDDADFAATLATQIAEKISAATHAAIDHSGIPGVGAGGGGGGSGTGFTEEPEGSWTFDPPDPSLISIVSSGGSFTATSSLYLEGGAGDAYLNLAGAGAELTATQDIAINSVNGTLTLVDTGAGLTLSDIRASLNIALYETAFNAKGDLLAASGVDSPQILSVGADGTVLTADSSESAGVKWASPAIITANRQTGNYTLVLTDAGKVIEMNVGSANTLTVPPNSSVAFPTGTVLEGVQYGAGQTTITPGSGVTIRSSGGKLKTSAQYAQFSLRKIATDEWIAAGELAT